MMMALFDEFLDNQPHRRRWYDQYEHLQYVIDSASMLPRSVQVGISARLEKVVSTYQSLRSDNTLKSFGVDNVLGLYKSQNRRRGYDSKLPQLAKSVTTLRRLPVPLLEFLNNQCDPLSTYLQSIKTQSAYNPRLAENKVATALYVDSYNMLRIIQNPKSITESQPSTHHHKR